MKSIYLIAFLSLGVLLVGCEGAQPVSNGAISSQNLSKKSVLDILDEADEDELEKSMETDELYFADSHGKIFYSKNSGNRVQFRTKILLTALFNEAKSKLPKKSRKKKINISLEVGAKSNPRKDLIIASQSFILSNKKFQLANTDRESLNILRKVLREEKDSLYKRRQNIKTKNKSDVILFLNASNSKNKLTITAKLISKNGTVLARRTNITYKNKNINKNKEWVEVYVPRNNGASQVYEVMRNAVTKKQYLGFNSQKSISNVNFIAAENFCKDKLQAQLLTPYVFESARKSLSLSRPTSPITTEIIAPYDEDDDEAYYVDGDNIEADDSTIITYNWNSEKYFAVSNLFRSKNSTFRCMKAK